MGKKIVLKQSRKAYLTTAVFMLIFAAVGSLLIFDTFAGRDAIAGTVVKRTSTAITEPYILDWTYSVGSKQLERPHVNIGCFRDEDNDGKINTASWSSPDLVYGRQIYLVYNDVYREVVIVQDARNAFTGTLTVDLLSGSSKLANQPSSNKTIVCSSELKVWDGNLRQQGYGIVLSKTPDSVLTDTR